MNWRGWVQVVALCAVACAGGYLVGRGPKVVILVAPFGGASVEAPAPVSGSADPYWMQRVVAEKEAELGRSLTAEEWEAFREAVRLARERARG